MTKYIFLLLFLSQVCFAEDIPYFNKKFEIELTYPNSYKPDYSQDGGAILILRNETLNNNLNVLPVPSDYDTSMSLGKQDHLLLDSYGKVGLSDAIIRRSKIITVADRNCFFAEVAYNYGNDGYVAIVTIIPAQSKHFVVTMVSPAGEFSNSDMNAYNAILQSIKLPSYSTEKKKEPGSFASLFGKSEPKVEENKEKVERTTKPQEPIQPIEVPESAQSIIVVLCLIGLAAILAKKR